MISSKSDGVRTVKNLELILRNDDWEWLEDDADYEHRTLAESVECYLWLGMREWKRIAGDKIPCPANPRKERGNA